MTENNGTEPKKPTFQFISEEDEQATLALPKMLLAGPEAWVDGSRFVLRRRGDNRWRLVLESSPATIVDSRASSDVLERG